MRFSFALLALASVITGSFAAPTNTYDSGSKTPSSSEAVVPKATCSYIDNTPVEALLSASAQSAALQCFEKLCEAKSPFSELPTSANCGRRNWSIKTPTAGHEDFFTNKDCAEACNSCIDKGVKNGYRHAQCDVTVEGVFGSICRVYYSNEV